MYDEYPTVYETVISYEKVYFMIVCAIIALIILFTIFSYGKVFKKASRSSVSAWVPFYNLMVLLEIVNLPRIYFIFAWIPIFNIGILTRLSSLFKKKKSFALGLSFLPFIFYPILAFDKSEYIGINIIAMQGKSKTLDVPNTLKESDEHIVHEEQDIKSANIDISIGGGVYEKDYTNDLLNVDKEKTIEKVNIDNSKPITENYISQTLKQEPVKPIEPPTGISFPNQNITGESEVKKSDYVANTTVKSVTSDGKCPNCGASIKEGSKVCFLCGQKLE